MEKPDKHVFCTQINPTVKSHNLALFSIPL